MLVFWALDAVYKVILGVYAALGDMQGNQAALSQVAVPVGGGKRGVRIGQNGKNNG